MATIRIDENHTTVRTWLQGVGEPVHRNGVIVTNVADPVDVFEVLERSARTQARSIAEANAFGYWEHGGQAVAAVKALDATVEAMLPLSRLLGRHAPTADEFVEAAATRYANV